MKHSRAKRPDIRNPIRSPGPELAGLTRRALLQRAFAAGALTVVGAGFIAAPNAAWALEVTTIAPEQMAALMQMARDIYPHDRIADAFYAVAVKGYDSADQKALVDEGRYFVGLALDETSQYALTDERLARWLPQVLDEMADGA